MRATGRAARPADALPASGGYQRCALVAEEALTISWLVPSPAAERPIEQQDVEPRRNHDVYQELNARVHDAVSASTSLRRPQTDCHHRHSVILGVLVPSRHSAD